MTNGKLMVKVCKHLKDKTADEYIQYFTGKEQIYNCVCPECFKKKDIDSSDFSSIEETELSDLYLESIEGKPGIKIDINNNLFFKHRVISIDKLTDTEILFSIAMENNKKEEYLFLTAQNQLIKIDFETLKIHELPHILADSKIDFTKNVEMKLSKDCKLLAVYNLFGQYGMVYDLESMTELIELDRGDYHVDVTPFTFAFHQYKCKTLIITSTDWDMIDVIDPESKQILTKRKWEELPEDRSEEMHGAEFRSSVYISPNGNWIVEDGWLWHPIGRIIRWDLNQWIENNKWEADDGKSIEILRDAEYSWGNPVSWIDDDNLLVWGYGNDDDYMLASAVIYDINTCEVKYWFYGPGNNYIIDEYLFSWNHKSMWEKSKMDNGSYYQERIDKGMESFSVWDIESGALILKDDQIFPAVYNRKSKIFLTLEGNGKFRLSKLKAISKIL
ncbi:MAG: hypothetical protein GY714_03300 [Desulfobacterales bacterium]|nr:hypothetical protein [Desulfobacterales bacterium]MCP4162161.1 hypothetical protein [Deltaproteobacteria bacterium]